MTVQRKPGLDIIRTVAICVVMITHMFNYTGILSGNLQSLRWTALVLLKFAAIIGVPLFLLLTGFLQSKRGINARHYTSIIPVLLSYIVISVINSVAEGFVVDTQLDIFHHIVSIFDFEYGYAWYVEMYIGLFLIIPFLNILYKSINKKQKLILIAILSFMTYLPASLQFVEVLGGGFEILPDFFTNLYVVAYYFIGAYIAEFKPTVAKWKPLSLMILVFLAETSLCFVFSKESYAWWLFNNVASATHAFVAVCLFLIFYNVNLKNRVVLSLTRSVAACSFEMYLISYMTDNFCYRYLDLPIWAILIVDFLMAFAVAKIIRLVIVPVSKGIKQKICK